MRTMFHSLRSLAAAAAIAACGPTHVTPGDDVGDDDPTGDGSVARCEKIDVLFVIDNSGTMREEQDNLAANFPQLVTVLNNSGLDYRVAVTTTARDYRATQQQKTGVDFPVVVPNAIEDPADNGAMRQQAACGMTRRWIEKSDPDPAATFACVAKVGVHGASESMPLGAMRDAFEERMTDATNAGFRRPDALLAVVFLTDEDDCSYEHAVTFPPDQHICYAMQEPVANYLQFLDSYTGHRSRWAVAAITGLGPGQCTSAFGIADEATRLKDFVGAVGANGVTSSICDGDLSIGLSRALAVFHSACGGIIL